MQFVLHSQRHDVHAYSSNLEKGRRCDKYQLCVNHNTAAVRSQRAEGWLPSNKLSTDTCVCTTHLSRNVNN